MGQIHARRHTDGATEQDSCYDNADMRTRFYGIYFNRNEMNTEFIGIPVCEASD